jgi:hypothetical protein
MSSSRSPYIHHFEMPDHIFTQNLLPNDETLSGIAGLPAPLPGDPRRQAVYSIQGTVYQAWRSIDAWLQLTNPDEVIYLEGAEDFDIVKSNNAIAVQVKNGLLPVWWTPTYTNSACLSNSIGLRYPKVECRRVGL